MKRLLLFCAMVAVTVLQGTAATKTNISNGVIAIVDNTVITFRDLDNELRVVYDEYRRLYGHDPKLLEQKIETAQKDILEQLIDRQLILKEFKTQGYNLPDSYIEDSIKRDIRQHFGDRFRLNKTLQENGETYESYRQRTRERIIVDNLTYKNINNELFISPRKIEKYYQDNKDNYKLEDQVKLRMIVIESRKRTPEAAKKLAEEIYAKLKSGASFTEMATVYSDGSQREKGGDWGWVERSVLRDELRGPAFALKAGAMSNVIELGGSYYIMLVEDAKVAHVKPLNDIREEIEKTLQIQERERLRKLWTSKLRAKAFVRYF